MSGDHTPRDAVNGRHQVERSVTLPYTSASVTGARQRLCSDLRAVEIGEGRVDDAALILSELVSNALRHASPLCTPDDPDGCVGVSWRVEIDRGATGGGWVELAVRDGGSSTMPRVARPSISGLGGRGLGIVQTLSGRWGTEMDATTTTVWAVLDLSADDVATARDIRTEVTADGDHGGADIVELRLRVRQSAPAWGALL
ncbi:ATP-binding protein [Nocardiopsis aegyptia]|uniref:Anti-sigma regulatory factor (Ser/Thr protein kinase) n=1 Tax=Nocardiopsis aegyptia TaxID=220378 RepID=A0A7Z0ENE9_9ACTN|nr:ATP-binding protein [Nocardiopsis aegyptia]NYJ35330.1 anti-sigma regulatory factor (Ser/Thr protein kinase) [Nocardiopsis aegyptia]